MKSSNWFVVFSLCAILGAGFGYFVALIYHPALIPPILRIGGIITPTNVLFLGTDIFYAPKRSPKRADTGAFSGRSDTILLAHLDPIRNSVTVVSIPRDTLVYIPGYGKQKINGANVLGGPRLAVETVHSFLGVPIDHYVVLNIHGLLELVDELGGITIEVPKRMRYVDRSAKLNIDLLPGSHVLSGTQAMGFVRYRHDHLGDIGRVQRQEVFVRAVLDKAMNPASWNKVPALIKIANRNILTDLTTHQIFQLLNFIRTTPKENQHLVMLPGRFAGSGDWVTDEADVRLVVARLVGEILPISPRQDIRITIENASSSQLLGRRLGKFLTAKGYTTIFKKSRSDLEPLANTKIIAERGNSEEALLVKKDLDNVGEIVNASVGDIESSITIVAGNDLVPLLLNHPQKSSNR